MGNKKDKATAIEAVTTILNEYMLKKHTNDGGEVTEEIKRLAEANSDLIMQGLYKEVWNMNGKRIEKEIKGNYEKKLIEEKEKLTQQYQNNERVNSLKNMVGFLFEGILIASLVGIAINQATELIAMIKNMIYNYSNIPVWVTTLIIIVLTIIIIAFMLAKQFIDKFSNVFKDSNCNK